MNKWQKYTCYCINWWWQEINQWVFEIIQLTEKTCKLKQIERPYFDYVSRFMKDREIRIITFRVDTKNYIKEEFIKYDKWCWMPFIFNISV